MFKNRLAPYILASVLIHIGLLFGMHNFLSLPDTQLEPPVLIPVEMVVLRKQLPNPALKITASEPIATKKQDSIVQSQLAVHTDGDQGSADIADPIPAEGNYQFSVNLEINDPIRTMRMASVRLKPAGQLEFVLSQTPLLHLFPADEQIYEEPPGPKKGAGEPRFTAATMPTPFVPPRTPKGDVVASEPVNMVIQTISPHLSAVEPSLMAGSTPSGMSISADFVEAKAAESPHHSPKGDEVTSEPVILSVQMTSPHLAVVEPSLPAGSTLSGMSTSADLVEAKVTVSPHFSQVSHEVVTALMNTQTGDHSIVELRPLPKQVESEPRLLASTLQINSHPKGAQVYVDGMLSGDTPLDLELTLGKHEVRLALPDYYDWKAQVDLTETNRSIPLSLRLLPVD